MHSMALATLRAAAAAYRAARGQSPAVGDDLAPFLGSPRFYRGAVVGGGLVVDGAAVRLTAAGAQALCPVVVRLPTREVARAEESRRVLADPVPDITPAGRTLAQVKRDVMAIYRGRALRALLRACRRWCRASLGEDLAEGIDLGRVMEGRVRYWRHGAGEGWIRVIGAAGRSNDCGCLPEAKVLLTGTGLAMVRSGGADILARETEALRALRPVAVAL